MHDSNPSHPHIYSGDSGMRRKALDNTSKLSPLRYLCISVAIDNTYLSHLGGLSCRGEVQPYSVIVMVAMAFGSPRPAALVVRRSRRICLLYIYGTGCGSTFVRYSQRLYVVFWMRDEGKGQWKSRDPLTECITLLRSRSHDSLLVGICRTGSE